MKRSDWHGLAYFFAWVALSIASGIGVYLSQGTALLWPAMLLHGVVLGFSYAASHECAHGTAFRTRWLNEVIFWITSLVFMEEPTYRRYSHASHHTYTWFDKKDAQKPYRNPVTLWTYLRESSGLAMPFHALATMSRLALGKLNAQERAFTPASEHRKLVLGARGMLLFYLGLVIWAIVWQTAAPFIYFFIPRIIGGWVVNLYINTQHMCMADNVEDHRYNTRSIECSGLERLLYWNMNHHIEHHLYPMVPFHSLGELRRAIEHELPAMAGGVFAANREILQAIRRQLSDPGYALEPRFQR